MSFKNEHTELQGDFKQIIADDAAEIPRVPVQKRASAADLLASELQSVQPLTGGNTLHVLFQISAAYCLFLAIYTEPVNNLQLTVPLVALILMEYRWARTCAHARIAEQVFLSAHIGYDHLNTLAELAHWPGRNLRLQARYHILRLVRDIAPGDHDDAIDELHSPMLASLLTPKNAWQFPALVVALLEMYTRTGDTTALPYLRNLTRFNVRPSVRRATRMCLQQLTSPAKSTDIRSAPRQDGAATETRIVESAEEAEQEAVAVRPDNIGMRGSIFFASLVTFVPFGLYSAVKFGLSANWLAALLSVAVALLPSVLYRLTMRPGDVRRIKAVAAREKIEDVGQLVDAITWPDVYCRNVAVNALVKLLPQLKMEDQRYLSRQQLTELLRFLKPQYTLKHEKLVISILKALEQIGDESAILSVQQLAACQPANAAQARVRDAAQHCLMFLPQVAAAKTASQTLLRMAQPEAVDAGDLLRSPDAMQTAQIEQLVRPADQ